MSVWKEDLQVVRQNMVERTETEVSLKIVLKVTILVINLPIPRRDLFLPKLKETLILIQEPQ